MKQTTPAVLQIDDKLTEDSKRSRRKKVHPQEWMGVAAINMGLVTTSDGRRKIHIPPPPPPRNRAASEPVGCPPAAFVDRDFSVPRPKGARPEGPAPPPSLTPSAFPNSDDKALQSKQKAEPPRGSVAMYAEMTHGFESMQKNHVDDFSDDSDDDDDFVMAHTPHVIRGTRPLASSGTKSAASNKQRTTIAPPSPPGTESPPSPPTGITSPTSPTKSKLGSKSPPAAVPPTKNVTHNKIPHVGRPLHPTPQRPPPALPNAQNQDKRIVGQSKTSASVAKPSSRNPNRPT